MSTSTVPLTQRAWVYRKWGKITDVLKLENEYPTPVPSGRQILIQVHAVALNPFSYKAFTKPLIPAMVKTPGIPEADFSGVVAGGNLQGTGLTLGQEVFGQIPGLQVILKGSGSLCQYTLAEPEVITGKPQNITHEQAAAFPLAGLTAYYALVRHGGLKQGDGKRVFINGGSGGVGAWAIQIAKAKGAYVVSTCSAATQAFVSSLGADATIDYHSAQPSLPEYLAATYSVSGSNSGAFDLILDTAGFSVNELYTACPAFLKPGGVYLDVAGNAHINSLGSALGSLVSTANRLFRPSWLGGTKRAYKPLLLPAAEMHEELKEAAEYLASGTLKAPIDSTFTFENALDAYAKIMTGRTRGKIVVTVQ